MFALGPPELDSDLDSNSDSDYEAYRQSYMTQSEPSFKELQSEFQSSMQFAEWEFTEFFGQLRTANRIRLDKDVDITFTEIEEARQRTRRARLWLITDDGVNTGKRVIELGANDGPTTDVV